MDHQLSGTQREKVEQEYLRNGMPSIVLALVTTVLTTYSFWSVQPNIESKYRRICDDNLEALGIIPVVSSVEALKIDGSPNEPSDGLLREKIALTPSISPEKARSLLIDTDLCLRRLSILDPKNDSIRFEMGIVAFAVSEWYRARAWEIASSEPQSTQISLYLAREEEELGKALAAMRAVVQLQGPFAARASSMIIERSLLKTRPNLDELIEHKNTVQALIKTLNDSSTSTENSNFVEDLPTYQGLAARIATIQALRLESKLSRVDRRLLLVEAIERFTLADRHDLITQSWRALAELTSDRERAQDRAWGAVQDFWSRGTSERSQMDELDAVLRGLLIGGDFEEAQSFVFNQLKKLPSFEQYRFREQASATCVQQLVAKYVISNYESSVPEIPTAGLSGAAVPKVNNGLSSDALILDLAVRLQPEMEGLPEILIRIANGKASRDEDDVDSLPRFLQQIIESNPLEGLSGILEAIQRANRGELAGIDSAIARVAQDDVAYGILATKVAVTLARNNSVENHPIAVRWLKALSESSPQLLAARFALGSLHLNAKEFDQAIECFESLAKKLPDNSQVQEMLESARAR